jgi:hypothetical protein
MNFFAAWVKQEVLRHISRWLILFPLLIPQVTSHSCGPVELQLEGYSFIRPDIIDPAQAFGPYLLNFSPLFRQYTQAARVDKKKANLLEWKERHCDLVTLEDLERVIYKSEINELRGLRTAVQSENIPLSFRLRYNSFAQFMEDEKCEETIDYLIFAKSCEPHVVRPRNSWKAPERDKEAMQALIIDGKRGFRKCGSHYIRRRYAYQILRLAHYSGAYQQVLDLYEELIPKIDRQKPSLLDGWMLSLKAGALRKLGNRVEAAYLFSIIFREYPSVRTEAFRSFYVKTQQEWEECLKKCVSNEERATLFAIRAHTEYSRAVPEMEAIYTLDPRNANLSILLVQELLRLEEDLLGAEFNDHRETNRRVYGIPRPGAPRKLIDLHRFVRKVLEEGQVQDMDLWRVADGYIELLSRDYYAASITFGRIKGKIRDKGLREQVEIMELVLQIASFRSPSPEVEEKAYNIRLYNDLYDAYPDLPDFLRDKMFFLYQQNDRPGKAFRSRHEARTLVYNPDPEVLDDLISVSKKIDKSGYERLLLQNEEGKDITSDLWNIKGKYFLSRSKFEAAAEALKQIPATERERFGRYNPFYFRYSDCVHCPPPEDTLQYDNVELVQKLLELDYLGKADFENGAYHYFQLGLALYNMTYYGYAWQAMDPFRSGASWYPDADYVYPAWQSPNGNYEVKDVSQALQYFELSRRLSHEKDKELAAKASYMAARCRQKMYFNSPDFRYRPGSNTIPALPEGYREYYDLLINEYRGTEFYREIIQECLYFRAYAIR